MEPTQTIFVTGATGNQGGAVVDSLVKAGFKIKALIRNPNSARAQNIPTQNTEIVKGDLNDLDSYRDYSKDVHGIFSVQTFKNGIDKEISQGIGLANLAKEYEIDHFLYSSAAGAVLNTGIPHFESKLKIENHIKKIRLPYTILRPTSLFENFLLPPVKSRILKGKLSTPIKKEKLQQFISAVDIGETSATVFQNKEKYLEKIITIASEEMDMEHVAKIFSKVLEKDIKYQKLPMLITRLVMGKNLYKMFKWINENDATFMQNITEYKKGNPGLIDLEQWIRNNFQQSYI